MSFQIQFVPAAIRQLEKLPRRDQHRIRDAIEELAKEPRPQNVKKMVGSDNLWRLRVSNYRVLYEIHDARLVVLVIRIAHRKDIYRKGG